MDLQPYLSIYLLGCILVIILTLVKLIIFTIIDWFTKANILTKNLKKIAVRDKRPAHRRVLESIGWFILEILLSWINVFVITWQVIIGVLRILRETFNSVPEEIKILRFPLRNNPYLDMEAVWAHMVALDVKFDGKQPDRYYYEDIMNELKINHPTFNFAAAIYKLKSLNVLSPESISMLSVIAEGIAKEKI